MPLFQTEYGHLSDDGLEYVITRPDTPMPWANVISNGDYGLIVSQAGGGYSWRTHASLNRLTRWQQDLVRDESGRFLYMCDRSSGDVWSLAWQPAGGKIEGYEVRHGLGYTRYRSRRRDISATWTLFAPVEGPLEIWLVSLTNESGRERTLSVCSYLEWLLGAAPDWHREFHRTFIDSHYDPSLGALVARKYLWEVPGEPEGRHWNRSWDYVAFHGARPLPAAYEGDKLAFLGRLGSLRAPAGLMAGQLQGRTGRFTDAVACLQLDVTLAPGATRELVFMLGAAKSEDEAATLIRRYDEPAAAHAALAEVRRLWSGLTGRLHVETPEPALNLMTQTWLPYQTIAGRLWGRTGYYQPGGAYGFRDQLQDSLVWLSLGEPRRTLEQVALHARHQFADGSVWHWWHPLAESGLVSDCSDDLLWLPYVLRRYLDETADWAALQREEPFLDAGPASLWQHATRAIEHALGRLSPRGLPLIGTCDWNDGLSSVGDEGRGESIWLGHFMHGVLVEWAEIAAHSGHEDIESRYRAAAGALRRAVNVHGWDGEWYLRATTDDGQMLGSQTCREGRIYLNAQTWAILSGTADPERASRAWQAVEQYLLCDYGARLLWPAYTAPDPAIGYLTRYGPGLRENGGIYTHAAAWAVLAACRLGLGNRAYSIYRTLCPLLRGIDAEGYAAEPYVTPGNSCGPDTPTPGRAGWTWYSGSGQWLMRVALEGILGLQPQLEGLRLVPCIPSEWGEYRVRREFRGASYEIEVQNPEHLEGGRVALTLDGRAIPGDVIPPLGDGRPHQVRAVLGRGEAGR